MLATYKSLLKTNLFAQAFPWLVCRYILYTIRHIFRGRFIFANFASRVLFWNLSTHQNIYLRSRRMNATCVRKTSSIQYTVHVQISEWYWFLRPLLSSSIANLTTHENVLKARITKNLTRKIYGVYSTCRRFSNTSSKDLRCRVCCGILEYSLSSHTEIPASNFICTFVLHTDNLSTLLLTTQIYKRGPSRMWTTIVWIWQRHYHRLLYQARNAPQGVEVVHCKCGMEMYPMTRVIIIFCKCFGPHGKSVH